MIREASILLQSDRESNTKNPQYPSISNIFHLARKHPFIGNIYISQRALHYSPLSRYDSKAFSMEDQHGYVASNGSDTKPSHQSDLQQTGFQPTNTSESSGFHQSGFEPTNDFESSGFQQTGFKPADDFKSTGFQETDVQPTSKFNSAGFQEVGSEPAGNFNSTGFQQTETGFQPPSGQQTTMSAGKFREIEDAVKAAQDAVNKVSSLLSEIAFTPQKSAGFE